MAFSSRPYVNRYVPSSRFPTGLKWLLIANCGIFLAWFLLRTTSIAPIFDNLKLVPAQVVQTFAVWQPITYMFMHASVWHLLWNMLALWMFGAEMERLWGTPKFLRFYLICGVCAALTVIIAAYIFGGTEVATEGSSGAVLGILAGYAVMFPDQTILFGFLFPMKSKYFVMIIAAIVLLQSYSSTVQSKAQGVAVLAHLGGMLTGYLMLRGKRLRLQVRQPIVASYREWKLQRAKRKFEVYLRSRDSRGDRHTRGDRDKRDNSRKDDRWVN
jgi:membrane associated rhomboid family serine protease